MAKMGRPKSEDPRGYKVSVRLTRNEYEELKKLVANNNLTIAQMLRNCVLEALGSKQ